MALRGLGKDLRFCNGFIEGEISQSGPNAPFKSKPGYKSAAQVYRRAYGMRFK